MDDREKVADEMLIMRLLAGFHVDKNGREGTSFLASNSFEERKARTILARQLRDGKLGYLTRELLALAIDPRTPSAMPGMQPTRKIKFESPARGKPSTWARDLAIVYFIKNELYEHRDDKSWKSDEPAINAASDHYGLERSRTREIWTRWNKVVR
jgi:hypothetical protein